MIREEAHRLTRQIMTMTTDSSIYDYTRGIIHEIYDDFESRTCENCRHYERTHRKGTQVCSLSEWTVAKDFGCNEFELKEIK